jgi:hypothetical protein
MFMSRSTILLIAAAGLLVLVLSTTIGCTQQGMAKHWGGTTSENLPAGQKLIGATWEQENLWYILRPMRPGEVPETITLHESSSWGVMQGTIVVHEVAAAQ